MAISQSIEKALSGGSRSKNFASKIKKLCGSLPLTMVEVTPKQREEIVRLAAACRASKAVTAALSISDLPSIDEVPDFMDLFCETYYPVLEDGKRTVGFWSIKDSATLTADDVHEWVRDTKVNKKTGKPELVPVPFGTWWRNHRPDYEIYGVAADRAQWNKKLIYNEDRMCVNTVYDKPPVLIDMPTNYGDGTDAAIVLDAVLERTIHDGDSKNAERKRIGFVVDAGSHLLALRDFGNFRCCKIFCFTSTNAGQGTGKSFLHESLAALVPRNATCTVPTTELAGSNLLALYGSSVCILTEAPSTSSERYTAEDIKAFADAGWKTATEKYIAKRSVRDNSLKLLSSNHLAPLPVDNVRSRRVEYFVSRENTDGGTELRNIITSVQSRTGWSDEETRRCVGWALLERAARLVAEGYSPCAVARRTIDASHMLSFADYDYFINNNGNASEDYSGYKDFRSDCGFSWSPDKYRYGVTLEMSRSLDSWINGNMPTATPPPSDPEPPSAPKPSASKPSAPKASAPKASSPSEPVLREPFTGFQHKTRTAKALLEPNRISVSALYHRLVHDPVLIQNTAAVRAGTALKKYVLPQIFPGTVFNRYSRRENIIGFTGFTHVDFDDIVVNSKGRLTPEQVRDAMAELPGFVIGAVSSRGNGVWAIFYAGDKINSIDKYTAAEQSLHMLAEDAVSMPADTGTFLPTLGRVIGHDPDSRICEAAVFGKLPEPYSWKAPKFAALNKPVSACIPERDMTADQRVREERFLEAVVANSCEKVQNAGDGERHQTAIKAVANVVLCCTERGITPLTSWGRQLRDACLSRTGNKRQEYRYEQMRWNKARE